MSISDVLTAIVAIYGALLATFTFVVQQREKKKKIIVKLWLGFLGAGKNNVTDIVIMEAANSGLVPVHLSNCCFHIPQAKKNLVARFQYDKEMPITLSPGESIQAWMPSEHFVAAMQKEGHKSTVTVVARFSNKAGEEYSSKEESLKLEAMLHAAKNAA